MKYINWYSEMYKQHGDGLAYITESLKPDSHKFLQHQRDQWNRALEADVIDYRWEWFLTYIEQSEAAIEGGEPDEIAIAFCRLGESITRLQMPSAGEIAELYRLKLADAARLQPMREKQIFIECAKEAATKLWANDHERKIRLGEMCERVYKLMQSIEQDHGRDFLPGESDGLKPWLRKVAPDYARRGGAPKK